MKTIYKYPIEMSNEFNILMPKYAEVLDVQIQHGKPYIWARVNTDEPVVVTPFALRGTGHECDVTDLSHVGTFQMDGGDLIFHLFTRRIEE